MSDEDARTIRNVVDFLIGEIQRLEGRVREVVLMFLRASPLLAPLYPDISMFERILEQQQHPEMSRRVRQVEQYLETHWREPITMAKLCADTGIPLRTLFQLFNSERGYTPMWFKKRVKLRHARALLSDPVSGLSVRSVAKTCGFANPGHFARDYFLAFGERPLTTLSNARGGSKKVLATSSA
jgi:transcriptional regulator GlxA family with amidase domain